ncbi:MAG TPA: ABC transporter substrate-binding protein [Nitrolancea sp.]|nr:ABC transporter substrate-binding protein [Nitrolancea sp.]
MTLRDATDELREHASRLSGYGMSRRGFVRLVSAGVGSSAVVALLAACGGGSKSTATTAAASTATSSSGASTATTATTAATAASTSKAGTPAAQSSAAASTGTSTSSTAVAAVKGGQAHVLWNASPVTLMPIFSTSGSEQQVERLMFGALVKMNDKLVPTPDMASKIEATPDAKSYTFTLHDNVKFSDGTPLTSDDVRFTFQAAIDSRSGSYWNGRLKGIVGAADFSTQKATSVTGIVTPDDKTVTINLTGGDAAFLVNLCNFSGLGIMPKHILKDVAPDQLRKHSFALAPTVTAGAFKFVKYATDQYLELARNDTYWGTPPPLDSIFMQILTSDVALAQLETGKIDLMTLSVQDLDHVKSLPNAQMQSVASPSMDFLAVNLERDYLKDKRIRQAMLYAIDRDGILKQIYAGQGEITNSPIFGPDWMGVPEGLNEYKFDPAKAKQLLKDAGWDGSRTLDMVYTPVTKERTTAMQIIQNQWSDVGLKVNIDQVDTAEGNRRTIQASDFDLRPTGGGVFRADPGVSGTYMVTSTWTPKGGNYGHYSNPDIDKLYPEAQAAGKPEDRKVLYTQIAKILNDELPWIFLYSPNSAYGVAKRLQGFMPPSYVDNKLWNAETWSVTS